MAYITLAELDQYGINRAAICDVSDADKLAAIEAASSEADAYISSRYTTALTTVPRVLKFHVARLASAIIMDGRGRAVDGDDETIDMMRKNAIQFFERVSSGKATLGPAEVEPEAIESPFFESEDDRGYGRSVCHRVPSQEPVQLEDESYAVPDPELLGPLDWRPRDQDPRSARAPKRDDDDGRNMDRRRCDLFRSSVQQRDHDLHERGSARLRRLRIRVQQADDSDG